MKSRKINALLLLGFGAFAFSGFTPIAVIPVASVTTPVVVSENKDTLKNLVTVNENAPVEIVYGNENPINEIMKAIGVEYKEEHEEYKYEGISEIHKLKYVTKNSEVFVSNYERNNFSLSEVFVEVRTKEDLLAVPTFKNYRVLVKIKDTNAPVITLDKEEIKIKTTDDFDPKANVIKVEDKEDGEIVDFAVSGDFDKSTEGEYTIAVSATDRTGNKTETSYKLIVEEPPVEVSRHASPVNANYGYSVSGGVFASPDLSHRAAVNGAVPGNCTWYIYNRLSQLGAPIPYSKMGNGAEWAYYARSYGYSVSTTARAGSVWSTQQNYYGHVAFVEKVNDDGSIVVSEMNRNGLFVMNFRTVSASEARQGYYIDFGLSR